MEERQRQFSLWYFVATFLILLAIQKVLFAPHTENLAYSDFKTLLRNGKVSDLTLDPRVIVGKLRPEGLEGLLPKEKIAELLQAGEGGAPIRDRPPGRPDPHHGARDGQGAVRDLARHMVTQYGMSEQLGLGTFEEPPSSLFLNVPMPQGRREYSERTAQTIDDEVAKLSADAHARVKDTLTARRPTLDALAKLLLEREVVDRAALDQVLGNASA